MDEQANKYRSLDEWFLSPQGHHVARAFAAELMQIIGEFSGLNLLQLGSCGDNIWLPSLKFRHQWLASPCIIPKKSSLISSFTLLPLERDSIDCVIAPFTFEVFGGAKNPIDEIDRILKPMGYAIFLGVNPISFWGAAIRGGYLACSGLASGTLTSSLTIKRAMLERGYRQCALTSFYYIPPVKSEAMIKRLEFFNEMGKMIWPFPAAFYCFIVQKYEPCHPSLRYEQVENQLSPLPAVSLSILSASTK